MSKHKMVDGRLLQMDKSFGQLKQKQREKIAEWMYQAYKSRSKKDFQRMMLCSLCLIRSKRLRSGYRIMRS